MTATLKVKNLGPITEADIAFRDLTVLVGPQATGKSITLQLLKLLVDTGSVHQQLRNYGLDWRGEVSAFLEIYFGEGMSSIWNDTSSLRWEGKDVNLAVRARGANRGADESVFYIPAQRVIAMRDGWPRPFADYRPGDPYIVRQYSEQLRVLLEKELNATDLFPKDRRLKRELREQLKRHVFGGFGLQIDTTRLQKRLILDEPVNHAQLPYMVWSAGQREFVPMLLGFYWLMPSVQTAKRGAIDYVVVEEPEMGLHPSAITVVLFLLLELVKRGYRVMVSTHSPQVLELVWLLRALKSVHASTSDLLDVFSVRKTPETAKVAGAALACSTSVYYFERESGCVKDISSLDPFSDAPWVSEWGGLAAFSARANSVVARVMGS
jgi:energy-coupling factor transporter ATP-binding protein EcfA2